MSDAGRGHRIAAVLAAVAAVSLAAGCTAEPTSLPTLVAVGSPKADPTPKREDLARVTPKVLAQIRTHNTAHEMSVVAERARELYLSGHNPNSVTVIDMASRRFVKRIPTDEPADMAVEEATGRVYVTTQDHDLGRHSVHVIDTTTHTVVQRFDLPAAPETGGHRTSRLAIDPPNHHLFAFTQAWKPIVSVLDTKSGATVRTIRLNGSPYDVAVDSKHGFAYISKRTNGHQGRSITVIDTATLRAVDEIEGPKGGDGYFDLAVDEDGGTLFAGGWGSRTLTVIDSVSRKLLHRFDLTAQAERSWVAFDRSARLAYFTAYDGIAVVDLTRLRPVELLTHPMLKKAQHVPRTVAVDPVTGAVFSTLGIRSDDHGNLYEGIVTVLAPS